MAKHLIDFQDKDSAKGVSFDSLQKYAKGRGCTVDELINIVMADFLGYQPETSENDAWEASLRKAGIPPVKVQPLDGLKTFFEKQQPN